MYARPCSIKWRVQWRVQLNFEFNGSSFCLSFGNVKIILNNRNPTSSLWLLPGTDVYFNESILTLFVSIFVENLYFVWLRFHYNLLAYSSVFVQLLLNNWLCQSELKLVINFPASRGLSRRDKLSWETSASREVVNQKYTHAKGHVTWSNFSCNLPIGHFRVLLYLCFKTSLSVQPFIWKWVLHAVSFSCKSKSFS